MEDYKITKKDKILFAISFILLIGGFILTAME